MRLSTVPELSQLWVEGKSSLHPIHGEAKGLKGEAEVQMQDQAFDLSVPPRARLELPVEQLGSGNALQDMEMRSSCAPRPWPSPIASRLQTDLSIHGVTRRIEVDATGGMDEDGRVVETQFPLDVRSYDVTPPRILGMQVHPELKIKVRLVLTVSA